MDTCSDDLDLFLASFFVVSYRVAPSGYSF